MSYVSAPARPQNGTAQKFMLAGHEVVQSMSIDARRAKAAGKKVYFITAGEAEMLKSRSDEDCANCGGFGHFALEVVMGGPFRNAPNVSQGNEDEGPALLLRPAWHNDAWWSVVRTMYDCPVCNGRREIIL